MGQRHIYAIISLSEIHPPTNHMGLLLVELGVVALFAFYIIPKARVAVTWVGIELLVS